MSRSTSTVSVEGQDSRASAEVADPTAASAANMRPSGSEPTDAEPDTETGPLLRSYGASEAYMSSTMAGEEGAGKEGEDGSRYSRLWRGFCAYSIAGEVRSLSSDHPRQ